MYPFLSLSLFSLSNYLSISPLLHLTQLTTVSGSECMLPRSHADKTMQVDKGSVHLPVYRERETLVSERGRERETVGTRDDFIGSNTLVVIGPRRAMGWCFRWKGFRSRSFMSLLSLEPFFPESSKPADWHKRVSALAPAVTLRRFLLYSYCWSGYELIWVGLGWLSEFQGEGRRRFG